MGTGSTARLLSTASFRFVAWYTVLFSISVSLLALLLFLTIRSSLHAQLTTHIDAETQQLLGDYRDDGLDELRHDIRERIDNHRASRLFYSVRGADGRSIFDQLPRVSQGWHELQDTLGTPLLIRASDLANGFQLLVAADLTPVRELESAMRNRVLLALLTTLMVGAVGGVWLSRRFLRRVDHLGKTAERIGQGWLDERIPRNGSGDEFDQLATTINLMLDRIQSLIGDVQRVSTNIAHDLRTPLGRLRLKLEAMSEVASESERGAIEDALGLLDSILETFAGLLRIAEIESASERMGFRSIDLSHELQRLADIYQPVAEDAGQHLRTQIQPDVRVTGDAALLFQLFTNLLENALRHAGAGACIQLQLQADAGAATAMVIDDGPGVPQEQFTEISKPFVRLDTSRSTPGNGLGLSLVAAIARLHGAHVHFADAGPGLIVNVRFPHDKPKDL